MAPAPTEYLWFIGGGVLLVAALVIAAVVFLKKD